MIPSEIAEKLRHFSLFVNFSPQDIRKVAELMEYKKIPANMLFIEQSGKGETMYFIVSGSVRIFRLTEEGQEVHIALVGTNNVVGEQSLIDDSTRSANVQTLRDTEVLMLHKHVFQNLLRIYPQFAINLLQEFSTRLKDANTNIEALSSSTLKERTWTPLSVLQKLFGSHDIQLSQEELAMIVGASRPRITEALNALQLDNKIEIAHRIIRII